MFFKKIDSRFFFLKILTLVLALNTISVNSEFNMLHKGVKTTAVSQSDVFSHQQIIAETE